MQVRFQGDFVFKARELKRAGARRALLAYPAQQMITTGFDSPGQTRFTMVEDSPKPGDITVQVRQKRPEDRHKFHERVLAMAEHLGLTALFIPERPLTREDHQKVANRLLAAVNASLPHILVAESDPFEATVQVTGDSVELLGQDEAQLHDIFAALKALQQAGTLQQPVSTRLNFGYPVTEFEDHPVRINLDPASVELIDPGYDD